ncbi:hypothetical protein D3C72_1993370 [compost metagenome]
MFILDVADDHLDDVFQRNETIGAAILIDDERHLDTGGLHALHQVRCEHRRRHEQELADDACLLQRLAEIDTRQIEGRLRRSRSLFSRSRRDGGLCLAVAAAVAGLLRHIGE